MLIDVIDGRFVVVEGPATRESHDIAARGVATFMAARQAGDRVRMLMAGDRVHYAPLTEAELAEVQPTILSLEAVMCRSGGVHG